MIIRTNDGVSKITFNTQLSWEREHCSN